jgi:hypothetical protein
MIVQITCVKVGHRQTPQKAKSPEQPAGLFAFLRAIRDSIDSSSRAILALS